VTADPRQPGTPAPASPPVLAPPVLALAGAAVDYSRHGQRIRALDGVDLTVARGEIVGLVGESGCGKSTLARAAVGLVPLAAGTAAFEGQPVTVLGRGRRPDRLRGLQMVFQDPYESLNPRRKVGDLIADGVGGGGGGGAGGPHPTDQPPPPGPAAPNCWSGSGCPRPRPRASRMSSAADSGSGSRSPAPWRPARRASSPTSRSAPWTPPPRRRSLTCSPPWYARRTSACCWSRTTCRSSGRSPTGWP
jgi:hypothetical protein